jgi:hypothetical protein
VSSNTPLLLSSFETCARKGFLARSWLARKLNASQMTYEAIRHVLTLPAASNAQDGAWGEVAGSQVMQLASDRGLDTDLHDLYSCVLHHAALADILVTVIRKQKDEPWLIPDPVQNWTSGAFLSPDGSTLRRVVLVSHWTEEREQSEKRSWYSMGEIAVYNLPMQMLVMVIGQMRNGRRSSPWVKGFLHPQNRQLRFRRKDRAKSATFNEAWSVAWREEHDEISRETWLNAMLKDDVLREVCFRVDLPVLPASERNRVLDMSRRKLDRLYSLKEKPEANLSSCEWPLPCQFKRCCWNNPEKEPSEKNGFIQIA